MLCLHLMYVNRFTDIKYAGVCLKYIKCICEVHMRHMGEGSEAMTKQELGDLIIASEETLYHVAKTILYSDADCSDAISETITKAFEKIHSLKKDKYARTWLIRILINECYQILRRQKRLLSLEELHTRQGEMLYQQDSDYTELYTALKHLKDDERISIVLYYLEGYSIKEIADIVDTTESAVKQRLVRGRKRMREELEGGVEYGYKKHQGEFS